MSRGCVVLIGVAIAVLAALAVVTAAVVFLVGGDDEDGPAMQVVLAPHPDDELQGWARIAPGDGLYTVFVVATRGEGTSNCDGMPDLQEDLGERRPEPTPEGSGTPSCAAARIDSWQHFLDLTAGTLDGGQQLDDLEPAALDLPSAPDAEAWVGDTSARVVLGLPDGGVQAEEVEAAVTELLVDDRPDALPDLLLQRLVATTYSNNAADVGQDLEGADDAEPRAYEYEAPDHQVVAEAAEELAPMFAGGSWITTHPFEAGAVELAMTSAAYAEMMALAPGSGPDRERLGAQQVAYGWLSFPRENWIPGPLPLADTGVLFPRIQHFRRVV